LKKKIITLLILNIFVHADNNNTVDENLWSFGMFMPWDFTYIKQENGKGAYIFPFYGLGAYVDYNNVEFSLYGQQVDYTSKSLDNYDDYAGYRYGASLLYGFNPHVKAGTYVNQTEFISTVSSGYEKGTLLSYGLKMIYNPNRLKEPEEKRTFQLNYILSLGYLDGTDVTDYKIDYDLVNGRLQEVSTKTYPDLSGYTFSLGIMSKF